ncbi:MAG: GAP family protein [Thermoleophilia bacterium]
MTGQAVGEILALGVGVALSPLAVVAVVVMLVAPHGARPAAAFAAGWATSLAAVTTVVLIVADEADATDDGRPASWVSVLKIVVGVLLVVVGVRQWGRRPGSDGEPGSPGWMRRLDGITVPKAAGLAVLFNVAKPKNLLLAVAAGLAVAQTGAASSGAAVAVATFVVLGSAGIAAPLVIHAAMPRRGRDVLEGLRDWMVRENATIIAVLALVIAAKLLGDALVALAS